MSEFSFQETKLICYYFFIYRVIQGYIGLINVMSIGHNFWGNYFKLWHTQHQLFDSRLCRFSSDCQTHCRSVWQNSDSPQLDMHVLVNILLTISPFSMGWGGGGGGILPLTDCLLHKFRRHAGKPQNLLNLPNIYCRITLQMQKLQILP